jgi:hypothetical protein
MNSTFHATQSFKSTVTLLFMVEPSPQRVARHAKVGIMKARREA